ncbi:carbohydrate porin [Tardiphaga sp.]|uniref:carbohydrate porin n=1 Tax=Tardiphaga sp. TaxID=1926292 RepID=UPI00261D8FA0|nr:carbohydrate porin [Tardiphaga sp.]
MKLKVLVALVLLLSPSVAVSAQEDKKIDDDKPADPDTGESTVEETTLELLPNPFEKAGVKFAATYIGETLGNVSGGLQQSAIYEGRLNLAVDADLQKLFGLQQLTFHGNMFQIHGGGLSRENLQNFMVVSGIEALPSTRLYELWFEQKWGKDQVSLKAGQLAADSEFFNTQYTNVFTNASLGWPAITSVNLPSGGPSPPLAALGARLRVNVTENITLLGAVFDGDAAGPGFDDPQQRNPNGTNFRINDPALVFGEVQYAWNNKKGDPRLSGTLKLGGFRHFGDFPDDRFAVNGGTLANTSNGVPADIAGNYGLYGVLEQELYHPPDSDDRGVGVFVRASTSPSDRNLIDLYVDAGMQITGLNDQRQHDKFGIAIGYARVSSRARELDADVRQINGADWPIRSSEKLLTAVYQFEIRSGWTLQPNFQYIVHPGGGASNPLGATPGRLLKDAAVFGLRTTVKF